MHKLSRLAGGLAMAATLGTAATPAMADRGWGGRGWGGGGGYYGHRHRGGDDGLGAFVGIAALFGAAVLVASSARKDRDARERYNDGYRPYVGDGYRVEESAAVDACAAAARDEAAREGDEAQVREITRTRPAGSGWDVDGTVDQYRGYRDDGDGATRRFNCTFRDGRVAELILGRETYAAR